MNRPTEGTGDNTIVGEVRIPGPMRTRARDTRFVTTVSGVIDPKTGETLPPIRVVTIAFKHGSYTE